MDKTVEEIKEIIFGYQIYCASKGIVHRDSTSDVEQYASQVSSDNGKAEEWYIKRAIRYLEENLLQSKKTQIGLPVQLFGITPNGRETFAAIIVGLEDYLHAETNLIVYNKDGSSFLAQRVIHKDFKKDGENYWDFLE